MFKKFINWLFPKEEWSYTATMMGIDKPKSQFERELKNMSTKKTPAKKAPAKKTPAKKAPVKKTAPKKTVKKTTKKK